MNKSAFIEVELGCGPLDDATYYREGAEALIAKLVPADLLDESPDLFKKVHFNDLLPLLSLSELHSAPCNLSVLLLCKYRQNACQFFYEMISRWLVPHKKVNVELFFASDVRIPHLCDELLSVAEIVIQIKSQQELQEVKRNLKQIETEIRLGVLSHYHARRIAEFKGLSGDGKTAMIQEKIGSLIQNRSKDFDRGIFTEMQHFLVTCQEDFKTNRDYHHISRIISNLHSVRKVLNQPSALLPVKRRVILKLLKTRLADGRSVLGILAGLNFLNEREIFEKQHLLNAALRYLPGVHAVEGSFFADPSRDHSIQANYLEIAQEDGSEFTHDQIQTLRTHLPEHLKTHMEQLTHRIFMPRNEEEVLRNIMVLSCQLRFVTDLPQMIVSFEEQRSDELFFTIVLLRVQSSDGMSIKELFASASSDLTLIPERVRRLGALGRKHYKEATVFGVSVKSGAFLRPDHSVDLYQARRYMVSEIARVLGEVRDFNGGMIGKQNELFSLLKCSLRRTDSHDLLLERFFYSLIPRELRGVIDIEHLKQFFLLLVQSQKEDVRLRKKWLLRQEGERVYAVLPQTDVGLKEKVTHALDALQLPSYQLISFAIDLQEHQVIGFLLQHAEPSMQKRFLDVIECSLIEQLCK